MLVFFIVNSIITPLLWAIDNRSYQRSYIEWTKDHNNFMTQRDLNKLYLCPDMKLGYNIHIYLELQRCVYF